MHEGGPAVLAGLHEAESRLAVRRHTVVRVSRVRRLSRIRRSGCRYWIRVRDQPDGDATQWRPTRSGTQRRALLCSPRLVRLIMMTSTLLRTERTDTGNPHSEHEPVLPGRDSARTVQLALLASGIVAPLLYLASDVVAGLLWEGYSFRDQTI